MTNPTRTCCGFLVESGKRVQPDGSVLHAYWCKSCGRKGSGDSYLAAAAAFDQSKPTAPAVNKIAPPRTLTNAADLADCIASRSSEIASIAAPFVKADRPAFALMVKKTTRYVMGLSGDSWTKVWATPEGRDSIIAAMEEAFQLGATLPDMGCMVPFGGIAEFIPDVEAYRFAVTTGASAPFESLEIVPVFKNDKYHTSRDKDGNFSITFDFMLAERGEVIAIAVYGRHRSGVVPGELYSVNRLIEKARVHSQSYRTYLQDVAAFEFARSEGKLESENGREYVWITVKSKAGDKFAAMDAATFASAEKGGTLKKDSGGDFAEQTISGKNGKPDWKKKIYRSQLENPGTEKRRIFLDELTNPYDGADRPEMLRKLAGKSFLAPYIKTRNSTAAINELQEDDDVSAMLDAALGQAFDAMPADRKTEKPAAIPEPSEDLAPPPVAPPAEKPEPVERKKSATKEEAATAPESPADDEENLLF